ncbi:MAG: hypothetical protein JSV77_04600 [Dehalococcoidales bacterium]|nr:MAG: hypothetical protein JSV77_04600 [Dehalococcoidales bacterium]
MDINSDSAEAYIREIIPNLKKEGFRINDNVAYKNQHFEYIAKKTSLEIDKSGFVTTAYLFSILPSISRESLQEFSKIAFKYTTRKVGRFIWPRSLFYSIVCFPVAIVNHIDTDVAHFIQNNVRKHWAACEMPVIYSLESRELYYFELTPFWGKFYWEQMRTTICYMLLPRIP